MNDQQWCLNVVSIEYRAVANIARGIRPRRVCRITLASLNGDTVAHRTFFSPLSETITLAKDAPPTDEITKAGTRDCRLESSCLGYEAKRTETSKTPPSYCQPGGIGDTQLYRLVDGWQNTLGQFQIYILCVSSSFWRQRHARQKH